MVGNFCNKPLAAFCQVHYGATLDPLPALDRLSGDILPADMAADVKAFITLASSPIPEGGEKTRAAEIAAHFDPVQRMIEILSGHMRGRMKATLRTLQACPSQSGMVLFYYGE